MQFSSMAHYRVSHIEEWRFLTPNPTRPNGEEPHAHLLADAHGSQMVKGLHGQVIRPAPTVSFRRNPGGVFVANPQSRKCIPIFQGAGYRTQMSGTTSGQKNLHFSTSMQYVFEPLKSFPRTPHFQRFASN